MPPGCHYHVARHQAGGLDLISTSESRVSESRLLMDGGASRLILAIVWIMFINPVFSCVRSAMPMRSTLGRRVSNRELAVPELTSPRETDPSASRSLLYKVSISSLAM